MVDDAERAERGMGARAENAYRGHRDLLSRRVWRDVVFSRIACKLVMPNLFLPERTFVFVSVRRNLALPAPRLDEKRTISRFCWQFRVHLQEGSHTTGCWHLILRPRRTRHLGDHAC